MATNWGTTGGGVSARFPVPTGDRLRFASLNDPTHHGRSARRRGQCQHCQRLFGHSCRRFDRQPRNGGQACCSAPQWAGLIAVMNAALKSTFGFVNPAPLCACGCRLPRHHSGRGVCSTTPMPVLPVIRPGQDGCLHRLGCSDGQTLLLRVDIRYSSPAIKPRPYHDHSYHRLSGRSWAIE